MRTYQEAADYLAHGRSKTYRPLPGRSTSLERRDEVDRFMGGQAPDEALESLCRDCYTEQGEEAA